MIFETERLYLRRLTQDDFSNLCTILQDEIAMYAYEHLKTATEKAGRLLLIHITLYDSQFKMCG